MSIMSIIVTLLISPFLLCVTIPLLLFAFFTTTFAFSTLLVRALLIYVELALVVLHNQLGFSRTKPVARKPSAIPIEPSYRNSTASSSSGTQTPKPSHGIYAGAAVARDFEGVGGWRFPGSDEEEDAVWTNINSRLQLPAVGVATGEHRRKHQRSLTSSASFERPGLRRHLSGSTARIRPVSAVVSGAVSPEEYFGKDFRGSARSRPVSGVASGTASPEGTFGAGGRKSRSMLVLGEAEMNVGRARNYGRKSSGSSTGSSSKTLLAGKAV